MRRCPACDSPDTIQYPFDDTLTGMIYRAHYPNYRLCIDCECAWDPGAEIFRQMLRDIAKRPRVKCE